MGLDMYLKGRRYLSSFDEDDKRFKAAVAELFPELQAIKRIESDDSDNIVDEVSIEVGYWRKANQIHKWFVKNVQDGEDECRPHYVSRENLMTLKEACQAVLADHTLAESLLPRERGFFFGGYEYDEWYFKDLERTIKIIDRCLALPESWNFEYCSSW
jgi:hypothetical protein